VKTAHAFSIALLLGLAAALGAVAATHTVAAGHAQATSPAPAAVSIAGRTARLDRWGRQLQRALHRRPPKLPRLVHFPRVVAPAAPAPAFISQAVAPAQPRTIYVRAKTPPASAHRTGREHEGEQSEGNGHDD
jgi:hypothetical protein